MTGDFGGDRPWAGVGATTQRGLSTEGTRNCEWIKTVSEFGQLACRKQRSAAYARLECYGVSANSRFNGQNALPPSPTSMLIRPSVPLFVLGLRCRISNTSIH